MMSEQSLTLQETDMTKRGVEMEVKWKAGNAELKHLKLAGKAYIPGISRQRSQAKRERGRQSRTKKKRGKRQVPKLAFQGSTETSPKADSDQPKQKQALQPYL